MEDPELRDVLILARKYAVKANKSAEAKHDSYGEYYMDDGLYEIMQETEELIKNIDLILTSV